MTEVTSDHHCNIRSKRVRHADADFLGVLKDVALSHATQEANSNLVVILFLVTEVLCLGEDALVILRGRAQCPVNEMLGQSEHGFAGQQTHIESLKVTVKHAHDLVNEFLGQ